MSRERSWWHWMPDEYAQTPTQPVTVFPAEPVNTGLVDVNGNPIMRNPERIGFLRDEKWPTKNLQKHFAA